MISGFQLCHEEEERRLDQLNFDPDEPLQGIPARRAALATPISRFERLCQGMVTDIA
jgi:hypothetical protein